MSYCAGSRHRRACDSHPPTMVGFPSYDRDVATQISHSPIADGPRHHAFRGGPVFGLHGHATARPGAAARRHHRPQSDVDAFRIPLTPPAIRPVVEILPVQLVSLALAALAGLEPGKFRLLTKVTTIE